jgi:hypothetical protein
MGWFEYLLCVPTDGLDHETLKAPGLKFGVSLNRAVDATRGWPLARGARYRGSTTSNDAFRKFVREKSTLTIFAALEIWDTSKPVDRPPYGWLIFFIKNAWVRNRFAAHSIP